MILLPFSQRGFFQVFSSYNAAIGLFVWFFYAAAGLAIYLIWSRRRAAGIFANAFLGFLWVWMAVVYHWLSFSRVTPAAYLFGAIFLVQGIFFFVEAFRGEVTYAPGEPLRSLVAGLLIVYALVAYPLIGKFVGHGYPAGPIFGLPCPTVIFTFGLLTMAKGPRRLVKILYVIPFSWAFVGTVAAVRLFVPEDSVLILSGIVSVAAHFFTRPSGAPALGERAR